MLIAVNQRLARPFSVAPDTKETEMADAAVVEDVRGKPADARPVDVPAGKPAAPATPEKPAEKPAEQKPADEKPAEQAKPETPAAEPERKAGTEEQKPKPPEKYSLTVPEGSRVDADNLAFVERLAKTAGWSNEDAQAAVDEIHTRLDEEIQKYSAEARADRDYGGDQFELTDRRARLAIDRIRPPGHPRREAFLRFLNKGGAFNNIEALSFLADLGTRMSEDAPGRGGVITSDNPKSLAERIYPNNPVARADDLYGGS